jgi:hypothetical protein
VQSLIEKAFLIPFQRLAEQFSAILPGLMTVLVVLVVGGAVAYLARRITERLLHLMRFDRMMMETELGSIVARSGMFRAPSDFAARLLQGMLWVLIILIALEAAATEMTHNLVVRFVNYVPDLITALLVLLLGSLVAKFLARSALLAAVNAQWWGARLVAGAVRVLVLSLTVVVALEQLRIGRTALLVAFAILFAGIVIALAIAFGLAGRDMAREWLEGRTRPGEKGEEEEVFRHL